ncbi:MAG: tetratricopeptide repeat protein, partial [Promethearchaeota archaeon]
MKPMGTITKYYPFIDEESKSILKSLMDESSSYYDFVQHLCNLVLEKDASDTLVYIAAAQCWYADAGALRNAILDKYDSLATIKPWTYYWGTHESYKYENCQAILQTLDSALKPPSDNWIAAELLLAHAYNLALRPEGTKLLSKASAILDRHPDLLCFKPLAYIAEGRVNYVEAKASDATAFTRKGYELARANSDAVYECLSILSLGEITMHKNPQESLDLFEQAYQIAQNLGVPVFTGEALSSAGLVYEALGEHDLAISSQLESLKEYDTYGNEIIFAILSRLYAALGDGQQSLEWADRSLGDKEFYYGYLRRARALIVLNRLDEAEKSLIIANRKVLQTGNDSDLALYYFVSGLLDMARGEFANAMATLEQAYEILYPRESILYLNETLIALATVELALLLQSQNSNKAAPGKWLSILENHARIFDMPGIAMQAALLRSEVFKMQDQLQDANETLRRAIELSDSPGVRTLRKRIAARMKEIEHQ